ncbi:hypothetical protein [Leptolyngbya ohadii]|uniref:hypothetical protein n=1 Tax=Leptolyngbya ohadii TaxID=1962290 RepID=UPI000B59D1BA|nr:hypothetical protein [Leptolyngbya ohadii]
MFLSHSSFKTGIRTTALLVLFAALFGLVFMAGIAPVLPGLDPSWQYALTKAHVDRMVWGRDIIFTLGPFGYLFFGSLIEGTFFEMQLARFLLPFIWILLSLLYIRSLKPLSLQLFGIIALLGVPFVIGWQIINPQEIYFIVIILLIAIDVANIALIGKLHKTESYKFYAYGVACAFMMLVKLNFGLLSMLCPMIALVFSSFFRWKSSNYQTSILLKSLNFLNWILFGFLVGAVCFLGNLARSPFIAIAIAFIPAGLLFLYDGFKAEKLKNSIQVPAYISSIAILCAIASIVAFNADIRDFIVGSLQIASGYSQAMTLLGPSGELQAGCFLLQVIVSLAIVALFVNPEQAGVVLCILLLSLMSFKHGFIRHGGHILNFAAIAPIYIFFLSRFSFPGFSRKRLMIWQAICYFLFTLSVFFLLSFGVPNGSFSRYYQFSLARSLALLSPSHFSAQVTRLFNPSTAEKQILDVQRTMLPKAKLLPRGLASRLRDQSVDIQPWSASMVEANDWQNWQPAPIFQAYAAYTRWLDAKNLESYRSNLRSRIVYWFGSVDGRHPYFDQPQTTLYTLCNYTPITPSGKRRTRVAELGRVAVLRPKQTPLCALDAVQPIEPVQQVAWNQSIDLEQFRKTYSDEVGNILLAKIDIQYSWFGKLYTKLFRTPPIYLNARYRQNQEASYRMVPDTAKSGVMIGSLPQDLESSIQELIGYNNPNKVKSISFSSPHLGVFQPNISIQFEQLKKQAELPADFNAQRYLELNPDIKAAGIDPQEHFLKLGFFENRTYK